MKILSTLAGILLVVGLAAPAAAQDAVRPSADARTHEVDLGDRSPNGKLLFLRALLDSVNGVDIPEQAASPTRPGKPPGRPPGTPPGKDNPPNPPGRPDDRPPGKDPGNPDR